MATDVFLWSVAIPSGRDVWLRDPSQISAVYNLALLDGLTATDAATAGLTAGAAITEATTATDAATAGLTAGAAITEATTAADAATAGLTAGAAITEATTATDAATAGLTAAVAAADTAAAADSIAGATAYTLSFGDSFAPWEYSTSFLASLPGFGHLSRRLQARDSGFRRSTYALSTRSSTRVVTTRGTVFNTGVRRVSIPPSSRKIRVLVDPLS